MSDFAAARRFMVDGQVRTNDVTDLRIIGAMLDLPRERFVDPKLAYLDLDVAVAPSRRMLKPMVLAKLIQAAGIDGIDRVLDVGCATGYSSALLGRLAGEVIGLEESDALAKAATQNLRDAANVKVVTGAFRDGWAAAAPYNVILVNGAVEIVPKTLCGQLADGGRLVCIYGSGPAGKATLYLRAGAEVGSRPLFDAAAATLSDFVKPPAFVF
ncbi:MAG: Protein-L-isoaspartate O-methyltransferase [Pseudolabrys sp.]|jgi:protein-L-isoaspartate(D-aspartate) O-methyltransferase|nr:Protein-L-isoaspartate O-methyltransferase [Pseudolabrys sp.]